MRLTKAIIVNEGLSLLDEVGFDALSMRGLATRLGVQVGALYYHIPSKLALLGSMADITAGSALEQAANLPATTWEDRAAAIALSLRSAMLQRRDGARLIAASPALHSPNAMALMARLVASLSEGGLSRTAARYGGDTIMSYVAGFVLQEQILLRATTASGGLSLPDSDEHVFRYSLGVIIDGLKHQL